MDDGTQSNSAVWQQRPTHLLIEIWIFICMWISLPCGVRTAVCPKLSQRRCAHDLRSLQHNTAVLQHCICLLADILVDNLELLLGGQS